MESMKDKFIVDNETISINITNVTFDDAGVYHCLNVIRDRPNLCFTYHLIVVGELLRNNLCNYFIIYVKKKN